MYDLKIVNGRVYNSDKNTFEEKDVAIKAGKIVKVGMCDAPAKAVIDAQGKIVSPGFIDIHMHESENLDAFTPPAPSDIGNMMLRMGVTTCVAGNCGNNRQSLDDFVGHIQHFGTPVNYMSYIGHNYLRNRVGNENRYGSSSKVQIEKMKQMIEAAMKKGALGLSFGLEYCPGIKIEEVLKLCEAINDSPALLSAHFREDAKGSLKSTQELIDISVQSKIPMQISHFGSCAAFGMMTEALDLIEKHMKKGVDISVDCYPYDAFSTYIGSAVFDEGCFESWKKSYDIILLTEGKYKGMRCDEALFKKVRRDHPEMLVVAFAMNQDEVIEAIQAPFMMVASDGLYRKGQGHPRGAGTFPKVLGEYVQSGYLTLEEALKKMTIMPAERLKLKQKGRIDVGCDADLVIFDAQKIKDGATFEHPIDPPQGIDFVLMGGKVVVENGVIINGSEGVFIPYNALS